MLTMSPPDFLLILVLALAFDLVVGEPPTVLHPVVWFGKGIAWCERRAPQKGRNAQLLYGLLVVLFSAGLVLFGSSYLINLLESWNKIAALLIQVFLLKSAFSLRMLANTGLKQYRLLRQGQIEAARDGMKSLVSRNVSRLSAEQMIAASIESVVENSTDSVIAPLFFYLFLGVPGALVYRLINTFDSMIGYRGRYEYLGKTAARLDDLLNLVPARLAATLLILSAPWYGGDRANAWRIARRDHSCTASPNAGWTMAAMAGALHVQLEKIDHYKLGDDEKLIIPELIRLAVRALYLVSAEGVGLLVILAGLAWWIFS